MLQSDGSETDRPQGSLPERLDLYGHTLARWLPGLGPLRLIVRMPGNIGDQLIWRGCCDLFERHGIAAERIDHHQTLEGSHPEHSLVIPGSGALTRLWHEWLPELILAAASHYRNVIVLPLPNVWAFARQPRSYAVIRRFGRAPLLLALRLPGSAPVPAGRGDPSGLPELLRPALRRQEPVPDRRPAGSLWRAHAIGPTSLAGAPGAPCDEASDLFADTIAPALALTQSRLEVPAAAPPPPPFTLPEDLLLRRIHHLQNQVTQRPLDRPQWG
jgi:hypothetical protein